MSRRSRVYPAGDVTAGEMLYLKARYSAGEAKERRERIAAALARLVRKGRSAAELHKALMRGIELWEGHGWEQRSANSARQWNAKVGRARRDVDRAIQSLRELAQRNTLFLPNERVYLKDWDDDLLLELREVLLAPIPISLLKPSHSKRGRPWVWKQETDILLRQAKVSASDRHELLAAFGFIEDK
jgi:hypothetical protein